jgi:hypothetical protein
MKSDTAVYRLSVFIVSGYQGCPFLLSPSVLWARIYLLSNFKNSVDWCHGGCGVNCSYYPKFSRHVKSRIAAS